MIGKFKFMPSIIALLLCLSAVAFGQETTGNIEVTVSDPQGNVVPGVTVTVTSVNTTDGARPDATTGFNRTATSDDAGFVRILQIPPGFYSVLTTATSGFGAINVERVEVVTGKTTPVRISLQAGSVSETVTVTSDTVAIDPTDNKIQTNITAQTAELLPKGVNFTSLLQVAPAVRNEPLSGGFQIDGASGSENTFIIDGQEVTNFRTGTLNQNNNIPFQFVQDIQIKSSGFEAEFGGATGGVINVVTKGGSNDFHGETGISFRPAELQAGPRRFLTNVFPGAPRYVQPVRDNGTDFFPNVTIGGPILRDRIWFLGSYAPQFRNINRNVTFQSPTTGVVGGTGRFNQSDRNEYFFGRLDIAARDNLRMTGSYTWNPRRLRGIPPGFGTELTSTVPSVVFPGAIGRRVGTEFLDQRGGRVNSQNVAGSLVYTPTSKLVVNLRGGYSFLNEKLDSYGVPSPVGLVRSICDSSSIAEFIPAEAGCSRGTQNTPSIQQLLFDVSRRRTFDVDASYLVNNFGGRHQFKGGYQFNGISNNVRQLLADTVVLYYGINIADESGADVPVTPGNIGSGFLQRFNRGGSAGSNNQTVFFQDSYQPFSRLTLNLGVRAEREQAPSFVPGNPSINFSFRDKVAPRIGGAFDLTGDGKTKIFVSYGQFFDRFKYELPRGSFGGEFFRVDYFEIFPGQGNFQSFTPARILGNSPDQIGGRCPIAASSTNGLTRCQFDFRIPSNVGLGIEFGAIDPDIKPFRQTEFTVGGERDLGGGYLFSTRYTYKNVDDAVEDIGFSSPSGSEAYIIGNPGKGLAAQVGRDFGFLPLEAERRYDAFELRLDKRFTRRYYFNANYTYSRLQGNYSGLASSDEFTPTTGGGGAGRTSPNVNRNFDLPFVGFTAQGRPDNGRLPTDRPHVFKLYGAYTVDFNEIFGFGAGNSTEFSGFTTAQSGTPLTSRFRFLNISGQILNERGDLGRTERFTQTDFAVRHKYRFGSNERLTMVFDFDVLNLFNESNFISVFENVQPALNLSGADAGLSASAPVAEAQFQRTNSLAAINSFIASRRSSSTDAQGRDLRFGQPNAFQTGRTVRLGFRLLF